MDEQKKTGGVGSAAPALALLLALLCLPLVYVLSIGPVAALYATQAAPGWVQALYAPLEYLADNSEVFRECIVWLSNCGQSKARRV